MNFEQYITENRNIYGGTQIVYTFPNGYGASVVNHSFSYGGHRGLFEMAVLHNDQITYDTPLTDDVIGNLTMEDVLGYLEQIKSLPQVNTAGC
jgi:hypothetical protein